MITSGAHLSSSGTTFVKDWVQVVQHLSKIWRCKTIFEFTLSRFKLCQYNIQQLRYIIVPDRWQVTNLFVYLVCLKFDLVTKCRLSLCRHEKIDKISSNATLWPSCIKTEQNNVTSAVKAMFFEDSTWWTRPLLIAPGHDRREKNIVKINISTTFRLDLVMYEASRIVTIISSDLISF